MRGHNASGQASVARRFLKLRPAFVAPILLFSYGNRQLCSRSWLIFGYGVQNRVSNFIRGQRWQSLAVIIRHVNIKADAAEIDADAVVGIVAKGYLQGHDACRERRVLVELFFVLGCIGPWLS